MNTLELTWFCTHCSWERDVEEPMEMPLSQIVEAGKRAHAEFSPNCTKYEIYFETEFISATSS